MGASHPPSRAERGRGRRSAGRRPVAAHREPAAAHPGWLSRRCSPCRSAPGRGARTAMRGRKRPGRTASSSPTSPREPFPGLRRRDEELTALGWWPDAAALHAGARWDGVRASVPDRTGSLPSRRVHSATRCRRSPCAAGAVTPLPRSEADSALRQVLARRRTVRAFDETPTRRRGRARRAPALGVGRARDGAARRGRRRAQADEPLGRRPPPDRGLPRRPSGRGDRARAVPLPRRAARARADRGARRGVGAPRSSTTEPPGSGTSRTPTSRS